VKLNPWAWFVKNQAESYSIGDDAVLQAFYSAFATTAASGIRVTRETAFRSVSVLACLIVRAETFAALPFDVIRREGAGRYPEENHWAYRLLGIAPNELMTSGEFWRWKQLTEDVHGNAYARIVWRGFTAEEVWPMTGPAPRRFVENGRLVYEYQGDGITPANVYPAREILHFKGAVLRNPYEGASLIDLASEAIGVELGGEQFFARLLGNGSHFPGYLERDAALTPEDMDALRKQFKGWSGLLHAGELRIFDRGLKYKQNPMSVRDAQLTESMRWELQRICSVFRVPPALVQDLTHGTYTNSEQQDLWLGKHTISPICINTEGVIRHKFFRQDPKRVGKFNLDGLLRGDYKTRAEGDALLVRAGIIDRNESRSHFDKNPRPGLDRPLVPLELGIVDEEGNVHAPARAGAPSALAALEPVLADAMAACRRRVEADRHKGRPREETLAFVAARLEPIAEAYTRAGRAFDPQAVAAGLLPASGDGASTLPSEGNA